MTANAPGGARVGVLFVCLGNICRSPLARVLFERHVTVRGVGDRFLIDSCGTGNWHVGGPADDRTIAVARRRGVDLRHVARQLDSPADFARFEHIIAMDANNVRTILSRGGPAARVTLLRSYLDGPLDVPDPYHGTNQDFEDVHELVDRATAALLERLIAANT